ncbi:MAG: hypothetical protein Q8P24_13115 [Desulfobacterales bacterium]|nr:hypothetical protein [Desulfobacterales bacterium]
MVLLKDTFDFNGHEVDHPAYGTLRYPFVLRITAWKNFPAPLLVVKKRRQFSSAMMEKQKQLKLPFEPPRPAPRMNLVEIGHIHGEYLQRCLAVCKKILSNVRDHTNQPLGLQKLLAEESLRIGRNLPLDDEAGAKLGLIFRLQGQVREADRVELIAHRVAGMPRAEALYWLAKITDGEKDSGRWARMGLRIMLGGPPKDPGVKRLLARLRDP